MKTIGETFNPLKSYGFVIQHQNCIIARKHALLTVLKCPTSIAYNDNASLQEQY